MNLIDMLSEYDKDMFHTYIKEFSGGYSNAIPRDKLNYFLRYWNEAKVPFYKAFGEKFILEKEIFFQKETSTLANDLYDKTSAYDSIGKLRKNIQDKMFPFVQDLPYSAPERDIYYKIMNFVDMYEMLVENVYSGDGFIIPKEWTVNNKPLTVNHGCKPLKMLGKIIKALGADITENVCHTCGYAGPEEHCPRGCSEPMERISAYELFRLLHSQVLNQKKSKGTICLSIHPLDYLTISDNECGWTSCMTWIEETGEYRLGTIEMMNSPCVVVAYLKSNDPLRFRTYNYCSNENTTYEWNSKRWRQLYIVTEEVILGNRQYPYTSDDLEGAAIKWLRSLMNKAPNYGPYPETVSAIRNQSFNTLGDKKVHFSFDTCFMYNDVYDYRTAYVANQRLKDMDYYYCDFSGEAICTSCGEVIPYEDGFPASSVECYECGDAWHCDHCNTWHLSSEEYYYVDGYKICESCWEYETESCECCSDSTFTSSERCIYIQLVDSTNENVKNNFNFSYYIPFCVNCMQNPDVYEPIYGKMYDVVDHWGNARHAFDIRNITDEGLEYGSLGRREVKFLQDVRDAKSDEERIKLIEEYGI